MNERNERRALTFASGMCGTERVFLSSGLKWCYTERAQSSTTTWYLRERDPSSLSDIPESLLSVRIQKKRNEDNSELPLSLLDRSRLLLRKSDEQTAFHTLFHCRHPCCFRLYWITLYK